MIVPDKVNAVLGKNITLGCRIEVGSNLTQSSWERHLRSGPITIAVYNPEFGISVSREYANRVSFLSPSVHDATIILEGSASRTSAPTHAKCRRSRWATHRRPPPLMFWVCMIYVWAPHCVQCRSTEQLHSCGWAF